MCANVAKTAVLIHQGFLIDSTNLEALKKNFKLY